VSTIRTFPKGNGKEGGDVVPIFPVRQDVVTTPDKWEPGCDIVATEKDWEAGADVLSKKEQKKVSKLHAGSLKRKRFKLFGWEIKYRDKAKQADSVRPRPETGG
jgi:hypothetical protein